MRHVLRVLDASIRIDGLLRVITFLRGYKFRLSLGRMVTLRSCLEDIDTGLDPPREDREAGKKKGNS